MVEHLSPYAISCRATYVIRKTSRPSVPHFYGLHVLHLFANALQEWEKIAGTKKVNRYRPPEVRDAVKELEMARERLAAAADQAWQDFLGDFAALYTPFRAAVSALAKLDTLQSLAVVATNSG